MPIEVKTYKEYKGLEPKTIDKIYQVTFRNGIMKEADNLDKEDS